MPGREVTLQDYLTLFGPDSGQTVVQNQEFFAKVSGRQKVVVQCDILDADYVTLCLETAQVEEKRYWRTTKSWSAVGTYNVVLTRDAGLTSEFLENFLRWRIASTNANWKVSFRLQLFLK